MLQLAHFNRAALRGKSKVINARFADGHLEFLMTPAGEAPDHRFAETRERWVRKARIRPDTLEPFSRTLVFGRREVPIAVWAGLALFTVLNTALFVVLNT